MMQKIPVKIAVPVYKPSPSRFEEASLAQTVRVLGDYPILLLHPEGMPLDGWLDRFPTLEPLAVSDRWLGTRNGIAGYNRMALSEEFYALFEDAEYLLICHTDTWIFRDELSAWCQKGYDCVGAPWIRRKVYDLPLLRHWMAWRRRRMESAGRSCRQILFGKVGNGGLSLRRVESFRSACRRYAPLIERYLAEGDHLHNEDVFWATVPQEFRYPTQQEALRFAVDTHPAYCLRLLQGALPFGCHSWSKPRYLPVWRGIIPAAAAKDGAAGTDR